MGLNPDVIGLDRITGVLFDIDEHKSEEKQKNEDGNYVSYDPPRFKYDYDFTVIIQVNTTWFDEIKVPLASHVNVDESSVKSGNFNPEYHENAALGSEIKDILLGERDKARGEANAPEPKAVCCPHCGATTIPDKRGCCEFCGGVI